jgi:hypothetical protein
VPESVRTSGLLNEASIVPSARWRRKRAL